MSYNIILSIFSTIIEYLMFFLISFALYKKDINICFDFKSIISRYVLLLIVPIIATFFSVKLNPFLFTLIFIPVQITTIMYCLKKNFSEYILVYITSHIIIVGIIEMEITFLLPSFMDMNSIYVSIVGSLITLLAVLIVFILIPIYKLLPYLKKANTPTKIVVTNIFFIVVLFSVSFRYQHSSYYENLVTLAIAYIIIVIANIELAITRSQLHKQQALIKAYETYNPIVEELENHISQNQHNYNNRLSSLSALTSQYDNYNDLCSALNEHIHSINKDHTTTELLKMDKKLIAGLLFSKYQSAQSKNKKMLFNINQFEIKTIVPEYELVDMIGILVDNAIEAAPTDSEITITLSNTNHQLTFITQNIGPEATPDFIHRITTKGYTTKENPENHGIGLTSLINTLNRYKGKLIIDNVYENNNTYITFEIII